MDPSGAADPEIPLLPVVVYYGRLVYGVISVLVAISSTLVGLRLRTRAMSANGLRLDDWLITFGAVLAAVDWISLMVANTASVVGPPTVHLSAILRVAKWSVVSEVMGALSVPVIKASVAVMLLRLLQGRNWRAFLYFLIGAQVVLGVFVTVMQTTRCIPINALWDTTITDKKCWTDQAFRISLTTASIMTIVTDVILSLVPLTFVVHIRRPRGEKVMIVGLMGLGIFASCASIAKTVAIQTYANDISLDVALVAGMQIALWANIEEQVGIIAACLPLLKAFFHRALQRAGLLTQSTWNDQPSRPPYADGSGQSSMPSDMLRSKGGRREPSLHSDEVWLAMDTVGGGDRESAEAGTAPPHESAEAGTAPHESVEVVTAR